jgi:hypothetical protein
MCGSECTAIIAEAEENAVDEDDDEEEEEDPLAWCLTDPWAAFYPECQDKLEQEAENENSE